MFVYECTVYLSGCPGVCLNIKGICLSQVSYVVFLYTGVSWHVYFIIRKVLQLYLYALECIFLYSMCAKPQKYHQHKTGVVYI